MDYLDDLDNSPEAYGVPHPEWRPSQWEAVQQSIAALKTGRRFVFSELPTGSGKSGIAAALGAKAPVLVLVQTLGLLDQYEKAYGFSVVKGMQAYDCVHPEKVFSWRVRYGKVPTVADCHFDKMSDCPVYGNCPYIVAREKALKARRAACTYKFAALSHQMRRRSGIVVLDEAHASGDELLSLDEFSINEYDRREWNLPDFPFTSDYGPDGRGGLMIHSAKAAVLDWASECYRALSEIVGRFKGDPSSAFDPDESRSARNMAARFERLLNALDEVDWFLVAGPHAIERYERKGHNRNKDTWGIVKIPGVFLRPLSARVTASKLWENKQMAFLMSATIGNPAPLAFELGIEHYDFHTFPHPTPREYRPVYDLKMNRMTWQNLQQYPNLYKVQAITIARWIEQWPGDWRGLILSSSFKKIEELFTHLRPRLGKRLIGDSPGTDIKEWISDRHPGAIAINTIQGWGHGLDLYGDLARFVVMACVPFKSADDPFEAARKKLKMSADYAWWMSYISVPQACGRVTRGEQYDSGEWVVNVSALADGSATTGAAMRFYPSWFREAIVPWS